MSTYSATPAEKKIAKELMNLLDAPKKSTPKKKRGRPKKSVTKSSPKPKECPPGKVLNPKTNRCNKVKTPKKTKKPAPKKSVKKCPPGKVLNPKTNRCNKVKVPKKKEFLIHWAELDGPPLADNRVIKNSSGSEASWMSSSSSGSHASNLMSPTSPKKSSETPKSPKTPKTPKTPKSPKKSSKSPKTPSPSPSKQSAKFYNIIDKIDPDNDGYEIDDKYDNDKHFINVINGLKKTTLKDLKLGDILFVGNSGEGEGGFIMYLENDIYYDENGYSGPIRYVQNCRGGMGKEKECEKMKTIRYSKLVMDLQDNNPELYGLFGGDWLGLDDIKEEYEALGIW